MSPCLSAQIRDCAAILFGRIPAPTRPTTGHLWWSWYTASRGPTNWNRKTRVFLDNKRHSCIHVFLPSQAIVRNDPSILVFPCQSLLQTYLDLRTELLGLLQVADLSAKWSGEGGGQKQSVVVACVLVGHSISQAACCMHLNSDVVRTFDTRKEMHLLVCLLLENNLVLYINDLLVGSVAATEMCLPPSVLWKRQREMHLKSCDAAWEVSFLASVAMQVVFQEAKNLDF